MPPPESVDAIPDENRALVEFTDYFCRNYPGPDTIIHDPKWHAPRIFRAAKAAIDRTRNTPDTGGTWRPIETAPKDGSRFLAFEAGRESQRYECWWQDDFANWTGWQDDWDDEPNPTHWMPLPATPGSTPPAPAASPACGGEVASPMEFFSENVDRWGAAEWFDRLAKAIRAQDKAAVEGNDLMVETYRNIAASSAMCLVRGYEQRIRSALTSPEQGEVVRELVEAATFLLSGIDASNSMDAVVEASEKLRAALAKIGGANHAK